MGTFSEIFGKKDRVNWIKEINQDIYEEISFLHELEESHKEKSGKLEWFLMNWDKGALKKLLHEMKAAKKLIERDWAIVARFKKRIKERDRDLMQVIHATTPETRDQKEKSTEEKFKDLDRFLELDKDDLQKQLDWFEETDGKLILQRKNIRELTELLQKESEILNGFDIALKSLKGNIGILLSEEEWSEKIAVLPREEQTLAIILTRTHEPSEIKKAIVGLVKLQSKGSIPLFKHMLIGNQRRSGEISVNYYALWALSELSSQNKVMFLKKMLKEAGGIIHQMAAAQLYQITGDSKYHALYSRASAELFESGKKGTLGQVRRRNLEAVGSKTILLGAGLVGKAIIRVIPEVAFNMWRLALESKTEWKRAGFNYIPCEPILKKNGKYRAYSFDFKKREKSGRSYSNWWPSDNNEEGKYYRVSTRVLGPSLQDFFGYPPNQVYEKSLLEQAKKIEGVLESLRINHGHPHRKNFCVRILKNGLRVYVIDFKLAKNF